MATGYTDETDPAVVYSDESDPAVVYSKESDPATSYTDESHVIGRGRVMREAGGGVLREEGGYVLREGSAKFTDEDDNATAYYQEALP